MLRFLDSEGEPFSLDGTTLCGAVTVDGETVEFLVSQQGEGSNDALLSIPGLTEGRWEYSLTARGQDGAELVLCRGFVAAIALASVSEEEPAGTGFPTLAVHLPGEETPVVVRWLPSEVARDAARRAEAALETVEVKIGELDRVMPAVEALESGIENAVTINEAGNWQVGNIDKGVRAQGPAGTNGISFAYHKIEREEDLPPTGSPLRRYILATDGKARLQIKIEQVSEKPHQYIGISVNGVEAKVYADAGSGYPNDLTGLIVNAINSDSSLPITAERKDGYIPYQIVELSAKTSGAAGNAITIEKIVPFVEGFGRLDYALVLGSDEEVQEATLSGGGTAGQYQYVWGDNSWIRLPLSGNEIATEESHGLVKLGTVGGWGNRLPVLSGGDGGLYVSIPSLPALERLAALEATVEALEGRLTAAEANVDTLEDELEDVQGSLEGKADAAPDGMVYLQSASLTGVETESGGHTQSPQEGVFYITLPS